MYGQIFFFLEKLVKYRINEFQFIRYQEIVLTCKTKEKLILIVVTVNGVYLLIIRLLTPSSGSFGAAEFLLISRWLGHLWLKKNTTENKNIRWLFSDQLRKRSSKTGFAMDLVATPALNHSCYLN